MEDIIRTITEALVDHPERVQVSTINGSHTSLIKLRVAKEDVGKVIGRRGQTVQSLRTILKAMSGKERKRVMLEVIE